MSTIGSVGGVVVWAAQCLAYIRYYHWFHLHKKNKLLSAKYNRWNPQPDQYPWHKARPIFADFQPILAWVGLVGCFCIVFVFSTATWWNGEETFEKVATAFAGVSCPDNTALCNSLTVS